MIAEARRKVKTLTIDLDGVVRGRGPVDVRLSREDLIERTREHVARSLADVDHTLDWGAVHTEVKESVAKFLYDETRRRPMVLPVRVEV